MRKKKTKQQLKAEPLNEGGLLPIDIKQCQAERQVGAFALGGEIGKRTRCSAVPVWIAIEQKPKDDVRGGMSLCESCKRICIAMMGKDFATFQKIEQ